MVDYVNPTTKKDWQHDGSLASIAASPVWAILWALTLGKFGKPLYRNVKIDKPYHTRSNPLTHNFNEEYLRHTRERNMRIAGLVDEIVPFITHSVDLPRETNYTSTVDNSVDTSTVTPHTTYSTGPR